MRQSATVTSVSGNNAVVTAERASMCDGCHKKGCADGCAMYSIFGGDKNFSAIADNTFGAPIGSKVIVETSDRSVLASAFLVFFLPLLFAFAAYLISSRFITEEQSIICALAVFAVYFLILGIFEKINKNRKPKLKIVAYNENNSSENNN